MLDGLLAQILEAGFDAVANGFVDEAGNADSAFVGERFQAGRDIDAFAVDVAPVVDDIAEIDAHAEFQRAVGHFFLHVDGAGDGLLDGGKLDQEPVAGQLDDAAGMGAHGGIDDTFPGRRPSGDGAVRVFFHKPRVSSHVSGKDGGQPSLNSMIAHASPLTSSWRPS